MARRANNSEGKRSATRKSSTRKTAAKARTKSSAAGGQVAAWIDDPLDGVLAEVATPTLPAGAFPLRIQGPAPPPQIYGKETSEFRHWNLAVALARGAAFWGALVPAGTTWAAGGTLPVFLDRGEDLNAYYDRASLSFFHDVAAGVTVYSGESPDIACHELGHAVLDALRPDLFDAMSSEVAAFHESFGDMCAILAALQIPSFRTTTLVETGRVLSRTSRLSRVGEQLGWAIRQRRPDGADPDCLRNASNSFYYRDPDTLPPSAPASLLSSQPHSFSRVFTGAFLDGLAGMLTTHSRTPTQTDLSDVSVAMGQLLVDAVRTAPIVPDYYSQIAAAILQADAQRYGGRYRDALRSAFVRRGLLSLQTATSVNSLVASIAPARTLRRAAAPASYESSGPLPELAMSGAPYGLGATTLVVHSPSQARRFASASAALDIGAVNPPNEQRATRSFLEELFRRGRIDLKQHGDRDARIAHPFTRKTHELQPAGTNTLTVRRRCFDCGFDPI